MKVNLHSLQFNAPGALGRVTRALSQFGFIAEGKVSTREEIYLDSFDGRLLRQNICLIDSRGADGRQLQWLSVGGGNCRAAAPVNATPRFAADLPGGIFSDQLGPLLESRALIPLLRHRVSRRVFRLVDREDKTVLRLVLEEGGVDSGKGGKGALKALPRIIRLMPVKGYETEIEQTAQWLQKELGFLPLGEPFPHQIFRAGGREPGGYSSKIDLKFAPQMTAYDATRLLFLDLWNTAEANEGGVLDDIDSEFLHDFRVSIRRTRSALSQLKGVFSEERIMFFRQEFSWLAGVTGPTRDLDVYLLALPDYEKLIPEDFGPSLGPLKALIFRRRAEAFKSLVQTLGAARYRALKRKWRGFLASLKPMAKGENADLPIRAMADERIWRLYKKLRQGGRAITPQSPAVELHDLRKLAKKLRYMFEFFKSLYPDKDVAAILKVMKKLQENLGGIQDYEVQADKLAEMAAELEASGAGGKEAFMAIGVLTAHLIDLQVKARDDFAAVFADFDTGKMHHVFCKLFRDNAEGGDRE
jgi:CHAD domain-containing protein